MSSSLSWTMEGLPLVSKRQDYAGVKLDDHRFLIVGGRGRRVKNLKSSQVFDLHENKWESWPDLVQQRCDPAAALCGDCVYVFGGGRGDCSSLPVHDSIECLNLNEQEWTLLEARLSCKRTCCTAVTVGTDIYVIGGWEHASNRGRGSRPSSRVDIFDTITKTVRSGPSLRSGRIGCRAAVVDDTIYVVGGLDPKENVLDTMEMLSVTSAIPTLVPGRTYAELMMEQMVRDWTNRASSSADWETCTETLQCARHRPAVAVVQHSLVIMGGGDNKKNTRSVEVYNTKSRVLSTPLPDMMQERQGFAAVTLGGNIVVVAGSSHHPELDSMEVLNLGDMQF